MSDVLHEGFWRLRSFEQHRPEGVVYPYGRDAIGLIHYCGAGLMSVQIMAEAIANSPRTDFNPDDEPLFEEEPATSDLTALVEVFDSYLAYFGNYSVDWATKTVTHYVKGSNRPNFLNRRLVRAFEMDGTTLRLSPPMPRGFPTALVWERVAG